MASSGSSLQYKDDSDGARDERFRGGPTTQ